MPTTESDTKLIEDLFSQYLPDKWKTVRPLYAIPADILSPACAALEQDFKDPSKLQHQLSASDMARITNLMWLSSGMGGYHNQLQTFMTGLDRYGKCNVTPASEQVGLTFITRPRLCLQSSNLRTNRVMTTLDTLNPNTMAFAIRVLLDTNFGKVNNGLYRNLVERCPLCDVFNPFMVPLCNALVSFSGSPDIDLEAQSTDGGYMSEAQSFAVGGSNLQRGNYSISMTFSEVIHYPILAIFHYWIEYIRCVTRGLMMAYADDVDAQRLNYTVSIYRFLLDPSRRYITKYAKYTGCFPTGLPIGGDFNFSEGDVNATASSKLSVTFQCNKVEYMDYAILMDFNTLVRRYCPFINKGVELKQVTKYRDVQVQKKVNTVMMHEEKWENGVKIVDRRYPKDIYATVTEKQEYQSVEEHDVEVVPTDNNGNLSNKNIFYKCPRLPEAALTNYRGLPYITSDPNGFRLEFRRVPNPATQGMAETVADQLLYLDMMHRLKYELSDYDAYANAYPEYTTLAEKYGKVNLGNFIRNAFEQAETAERLDPITNKKKTAPDKSKSEQQAEAKQAQDKAKAKLDLKKVTEAAKQYTDKIGGMISKYMKKSPTEPAAPTPSPTPEPTPTPTPTPTPEPEPTPEPPPNPTGPSNTDVVPNDQGKLTSEQYNRYLYLSNQPEGSLSDEEELELAEMQSELTSND